MRYGKEFRVAGQRQSREKQFRSCAGKEGVAMSCEPKLGPCGYLWVEG